MIQLKTVRQNLQLKGTTAPQLVVQTAPANTIKLVSSGPRGPRGEPGVGLPGLPGSPGATGPAGPRGADGQDADPAVVAALNSRVDALTTNIRDIINFAPETLNAFSEVASALNNDPQFAQTMTTALGNRVRYDAAQALTSTQRNVVRSNIDAASYSDAASKLPKESYVRSLQVVVPGKPTANALLGGGITPQSGTIDASASMFSVDTAPTSDTSFSLRINGTQRGTVTVLAGQTVGVLALPATTLVVGDRIAFYAGAADATLAGLIGSLVVRL